MVQVGRANIDEIRGLSPAQEGMLFHTILAPDSPLYVNQYICTIEGDLDIDRYREAWSQVFARHAALRSFFTWKGRERPLQVIRSRVEPTWLVAEVADVSEAQRMLDAERRRGFDLETAPLSRFSVIRTDADTLFAWTHHHLVLDGWSLGLVVDEALETYDALTGRRTPTPRPIADHSRYEAWLAGQDRADEEAHWRSVLKGVSQPTLLRIPGPGDSVWAESQLATSGNLSIGLSGRLREFARNQGVTLSTLMRGAWALLVGRYSGSEDVMFGAAVSARSPEIPGVLDLVGMYLNTATVRVATDPTQEVSEWLQSIETARVAATPYEHTALTDAQRWSGLDRSGPLFDTLLAVENIPEPSSRDDGLRLGSMRYLQQSNYPLAMLVLPRESIELALLHDAKRVNVAMAQRILAQMSTILESMSTAGTLAEVEIFPADQLREIVARAAGNDLETPVGETVILRIQRAAAERSDRVAIGSEPGGMTYGDLQTGVERFASHLLARGVAPGSTVAIIAPRSVDSVIAMLGTLRAGSAYAPIAPNLPESDLELILSRGTFDALAVPEGHGPVPGASTTTEVGPVLDGVWPLPDAATANLVDAAYLMHTSGTTGVPKAVEITHANLAYSNAARDLYYERPPGRFLLASPFHFDSSVVGLYWTLSTGGRLVIPPEGAERDVAGLAGIIAREQITHTLMIPTLWEALLTHGSPYELSSLEVVIVAGEECPARVLAAHADKLGAVELFNEYGPTEGTVWSTVARLHPDGPDPWWGRVPIGRPIPGALNLVLDDGGRPTPPGVVGELVISGPGLARGYRGASGPSPFREIDVAGLGLRRTYATGDLVVQSDSGDLYFRGRDDNQVKLRGQRLELEAVDVAIGRIEGVRKAGSVAVVEAGGSTRLIGFVESELTPGDLLEKCRSLLAPPLVPHEILTLPSIPLNRSGKVDRTKLRSLYETPDDAIEQVFADSTQQKLADIWAGVIGRSDFGPDDDFFAIGGDSLLAIRVIARAHESGMLIDAARFYENPTISHLAAGVSIAEGGASQ